MKNSKLRRVLLGLYHYMIFFMLVAFVTSCCVMLFVTMLSQSMGLQLNDENIGEAAKVTFINVLLLSFIFTLIDLLRRRLTVDAPVEKIKAAVASVVLGDFSVRIDKGGMLFSADRFGEIIDGFNHMVEELSAVEALSDDFIASVSHELKTPLAVMQNYSKMLTTPGISEKERAEYANKINEACKGISSLVSNILRLNKLENQTIVVEKERFNLTEQLSECIISHEYLVEAKGLDIECELEDDIYVFSDPEMLALVWNNLLSNAVKFTDKGKISCSLTAVGDSCEVKISDTGCGISREVGSKIFDKFYQADSSRATGGNGLGLALVKRVTDLVGGEISVKSTEGVGSEFAIRILRGV